jgi:glucosamine-6-phosphate deaminase
MKRFKVIVTHRTVSEENFDKMMGMDAGEINRWSPINVKIVKKQHNVYETMARSIADEIKEKNSNRLITKLILPVGPTPQYKILADICNKERINWKNVYTFGMDEYLDWEGRLIPENHPMSFKSLIMKDLFNKLDSDLRIPENQTIWLDPQDLDFADNKIEKLGGIDVCYDGLGYHGHIAFNEPINTYFQHMTIKKFLSSRTHIVDLNSDTFVINSMCGIGGNCYRLPPKAITLGMKCIMEAGRIEIYCDGGDLNWQLASFRITAMHPPTVDRPSTLLQLHNNPKEKVLLVGDENTARPISINPK